MEEDISSIEMAWTNICAWKKIVTNGKVIQENRSRIE